MNIPYQELQAAGVDLGAVIAEDFLNTFSAAHFGHVPDIYSGKQRFTDFGNDIEIAYSFQHPLIFHLTQIPLSKFKPIWHSHLRTKGASSLRVEQIVETPANLSLDADQINFTVTCYEGSSSTVILTIDFTWNLEARCAVTLSNGILTLEPIKIVFAPGDTQLRKLIREKLAQWSRQVESPADCGAVGKPKDPVWCAKAEEFILFLLNTVLAREMTNFVRSWTLPNAIQLFDGVQFSPNFLAIHDGLLVLGGKVSSQPVGTSSIQREIDSLMLEFSRRATEEFANATDEDIKGWNPEHSPTVNWLHAFTSGIVQRVADEQRVVKGDLASATVALCSNDQLFDVLAKKYLSANQGWNGGASIDHIVKVDVGWWFRVENATGKVVPSGIEVNASVSIGGSISVCHFDLDPKHFGSWACNGIALELRPLPDPPGFDIRGYPSFAADGIYLSADLRTLAIGLQVPGWPGWANDILGWVTGVMTFPLLTAIRAVISLLHIRIAQYPKFFPGTGLEWIPNMSSTPENAGPYLVFSAAPQFK